MHTSSSFIKGLKLLPSLLLLLLHPGAAQQLIAPSSASSTSQANTWLMFLSDVRLSQRWGLHAEAQVLRTHTSEQGLQNVLRTGANYYATDALLLTGGYAYSRAFPDAGYPLPTAPEHRLYQQIQLHDTGSRVQVQHRYRLEQRWVQLQPAQNRIFLNRMRYQLRLTMPLLGKELAAGIPFVTVSDEVFVGFGRREGPGFLKQNRAYAALGYQLSKAAAVEIGYLNQLVRPLSEASRFELNENLQLSLCFHPDFRRNMVD
ncbi:hypothetical protein CDA63_20015 [Hymenobacter amundsenii]|uniref:DUF2490 domain-containing protein n=1 Tax=Hymenobacter amundsenii TaxID=2006685 RepID=A0A246FFM7_9BACT|nr:DUF2490 domain-containing protein [Hymenobacter amundsenii]OWP61328.1 hypothetical protein CDA63_20015 [Hymenobacter amundsenii]